MSTRIVNFTTERSDGEREERHAARTHGATLVDELRGRGGRAALRRVSRSAAHHPRCLCRGRPQTPAVAAVRTARTKDTVAFLFIIHFESPLDRRKREKRRNVITELSIRSFADFSILIYQFSLLVHGQHCHPLIPYYHYYRDRSYHHGYHYHPP